MCLVVNSLQEIPQHAVATGANFDQFTIRTDWTGDVQWEHPTLTRSCMTQSDNIMHLITSLPGVDPVFRTIADTQLAQHGVI